MITKRELARLKAARDSAFKAYNAAQKAYDAAVDARAEYDYYHYDQYLDRAMTRELGAYREVSRETITVADFLARKDAIYPVGATTLKCKGRNVVYISRHIETGNTFAVLSTYKGKIDVLPTDTVTIIRKQRSK